MSEEIWRPVTVAPDRYEVSNRGRVRYVGPIGPVRLLKPVAAGRGGYPGVTIDRRTWKIHRLVAFAFLEGTGPLVRHLDDVPTNNCVENLAWGTYSENAIDMVNHGNHPMTLRTHCPKGHQYTPENTGGQKRKGGYSRYCRTCSRASTAAWKAKRAAA